MTATTDMREWFTEVPAACFVMAGVIATFEFQDLLFLTLSAVPERIFSLMFALSNWGPALILGTLLALALQLRRDAVLAWGLSFGSSYYMVTSMRGAAIRFGTLDDWRIPTGSWSSPMLLSGLVGALIGGILYLTVRPKVDIGYGFSWCAVAGLGAIAACSAYYTFVGNQTSVFAPTRPYALAGLIVGLAAILGVSQSASFHTKN